MKKFLALLLALLMVFCTACGKDEQEGEQGKQPSQQQTAQSGYAYKANYIPIDTGEYDFNYCDYFALVGDSIYVTASYQTGTEPLMDEATGEPMLDENGEPIESPILEYGLFRLGLDGSFMGKVELDLFKPPEGSEGGGYLSSISSDGKDGLWVVEDASSYHYDLPEDFDPATGDMYQYYVDDGRQTILHHIDSQGTVTEKKTLAVPPEVYIYNPCFAPDGSIYASDWQNLYQFDQSGQIQKTLPMENGVNSMMIDADGKLVITTWKGETDGIVMLTIDTATMTAGEETDLPYNAYQIYPGFGDYDYLYFNGDSAFGFKKGEQTDEKILSWLDCDVDQSSLGNFFFTQDGTCYAMENKYDETAERSTYQLIRMDRVEASTLPQKQVLTLACLGLDWDVRNEILEFNRSHDDIRITVKDYSEYATEEDYYAGLTKLNTEILSGAAPDLFLNNGGMPIETYAAKGLLVDLWPLIDADQELSREDLMTHFFDVLSINGKLYQVCDNFGISTIVGRSDVIGTADSWTIDDMLAIKNDFGEEMTIFSEYETRENMIYSVLLNNVEQFVDWETKQCSFDSETFQGLLELMASFPETFDDENFDWEGYGSDPLRMRMRQQMVTRAYIDGFDQIQYYNAMCEGKPNFIGFPSADGTGSTFMAYSGLSISASCANMDAAWSFVRTVLTEDYQTQEYMYQFPTNRHSFEAYMKQQMTPRWFETDPETGEEVEGPRNWLYFSEDEEVKIFSMTQEEYDLFTKLYEKTNTMSGSNSEIGKIVEEECKPFFAGQKTAADTAAMIQDRVGVYVFEQG